MTPAPEARDRPFPGARSQVPGTHYEHTAPGPRERAAEQPLALESSPAGVGSGWSIRLPVRAEQISVDKQVVVYERVQVRRREVVGQEHLTASVRKEELRVAVDRNRGETPAGPEATTD